MWLLEIFFEILKLLIQLFAQFFKLILDLLFLYLFGSEGLILLCSLIKDLSQIWERFWLILFNFLFDFTWRILFDLLLSNIAFWQVFDRLLLLLSGVSFNFNFELKYLWFFILLNFLSLILNLLLNDRLLWSFNFLLWLLLFDFWFDFLSFISLSFLLSLQFLCCFIFFDFWFVF